MRKHKLDEIFSIQIGKTPSRAKNIYWEDGNTPWVSISDLNNLEEDKYIIKTKETITDIAIAESGIKPVPPLTLLYSFKLSVGKVAITKDYIYTNEAIAAFIPNKGIETNVDFLFYFFKGFKIDNLLHNAVMGKSLNKEKLSNIGIDLPPIEIQNNIANTLNKAYSLISKRQKSIELLEEYVNSIFFDIFGDPVLNPKNWSLKKLDDLVPKERNAIKAGPFGSALKKEYYVKSGYKIYGQEQVIKNDLKYGDYYIDAERYEKLKSCKINAGDVLISLVGTLGKVAIVPNNFEPGIINPRLIKITFDKKIVNPFYFKYLFETKYIESYLKNKSKGGTVKTLSLAIIKQIDFPIPNIKLQNQFEYALNKITFLRELKIKSNFLLDELFKSLQYSLFNQTSKLDEIDLFIEDELKVDEFLKSIVSHIDKTEQQYNMEKDLLFKILERTEKNNKENKESLKGIVLKFEKGEIALKTNKEDKFNSNEIN